MNPQIGPYRLLETLGRGGMAEVWRAQHIHNGRTAAVKIILTQRALDDRLLAAFFDEARQHAALVHPNIAAIYDYGHIAERDTPPPKARHGLPYLVMEVAQGSLREHFPHTWPQTQLVLQKILHALAFAHAHDVVHRDLKPENILVCDDELKLSDFGIVFTQTEARITTDHITSSAGAGTPYYMAPEQLHARWREFGPWTDLYAFGCMAFELVCGTRPYEGNGLLNIAMKHLNGPFPALQPRFPVPPQFATWLAHLVARDPRARFQFAADALDALLRLNPPTTLTPTAPLPGFFDDAESAATLIDAHSATLDDLDALHPTAPIPTLAAHTDDIAALTSPAPSCPVPNTWKGQPTPVVWSGLGLLGMRAPGLVGLDDAREKLWTELMCANTGLHITSIRGTEAEPVDALRRWLTTRAHELGAARTLVAHHSRVTHAGQNHIGEGLAGLVDQMFQLWSLDAQERLDRITSQLQLLLPGLERPLLEASAHTLVAESIADKHLGRSRAERFGALTTAIRALSASRPLIVCLENAQWANETLHFVQHLRQHHPQLPVLALITCKTDHIDPLSETSLLLEHHAAHHPTLDLRPLHAGELERWIEHVLPLDENGRTTIIERCEGDPRLAMWLIDDALQRHAIRETQDAFTLTAPLASSAQQMFIDRIDALLDQLPPNAHRDAQAWYEALATLEHTTSEELGAILSAAGHAPSPAQRLFAESGLLTTEHNRIALAHPAIRDAIIQRMKTQNTWASWNQTCLSVLKDRHAPSARLANHADEIEDVNLRLRTYVQGIRDHQTSNLRLASRFAELASNLEHHASDRAARVDLHMLKGVLMHARGDLEGSIATVQAAETEARNLGYLLVVARCSMFLAIRDCDRGAFQDALKRLAVCVNVFENLDEQEVLASALLLVGFCLTHLDRRVEAIGAYQRACDICEARDMVGQLTVTQSYVANLHLDLGQFDRARQVAHAALKRIEPLGLAKSMGDIHLVLGEIERLDGHLDDALRHYEESHTWLTLAGSRDAAVAQFNRLLVLFAQADHTAANILPDVKDLLTASGYDYLAQNCDRLQAWLNGQLFVAGTDPDLDWLAAQTGKDLKT